MRDPKSPDQNDFSPSAILHASRTSGPPPCSHEKGRVERHDEHLFCVKVVGGSKFWRKWRGVLVMPLHVGDSRASSRTACIA
jgi:hypothetical protein